MRHTIGRGIGLLAVGTVMMGAGALGWSAVAPQAVQAEHAELRRADVMLVKIHADWCPKCAAQTKNWTAAQDATLGQEDVLFVHLDITNAQTRAHSEMLANELGLGNIWEARSKRTGQMFLVDRESKKIVADFSYTAPASEVTDAIASAAGS